MHFLSAVPSRLAGISISVFLYGALLADSATIPAQKRSEGNLVKRWASDTVSETMCTWAYGASAIVKDKLYIDGGDLMFLEQLQFGGVRRDEKIRNVFYGLDLTRPFDIKTVNMSQVFKVIDKRESDMAHTYNHFMMANDYEFLLFGGDLRESSDVTYLKEKQIPNYEFERHGNTVNWAEGWQRSDTDDVNNYVSKGAGANAVSENLAFYFSGRKDKEGKMIKYRSSTHVADVFSDTMVIADLSLQRNENYRTVDLKNVKPRIGAEMVWIPVGEKGSLVIIGGVANDTESPRKRLYDDDLEEASDKSRDFSINITIFDIATEEWHIQKTVSDGLPPVFFDFCAVAVSTEDRKSHHIFVHGGREGLDRPKEEWNKSVWVLSLPAMTWTEIPSEEDVDTVKGRAGHRCHLVGRNKMMIVGGRTTSINECLPHGFVRVFNLNTLKYESVYHPTENEERFQIPQRIRSSIEELPKAKLSDAVEELFNTPYPSKIVELERLPFKAGLYIGDSPDGAISDDDERNKKEESDDGGSSGMPGFVPPLLGTLLGVFVVILILCAALFFIRRKKARNSGDDDAATEATTVKRMRQTWRWVVGGYGDEKANHSRDALDYNLPPPDNGYYEPRQDDLLVDALPSPGPGERRVRIQSTHTEEADSRPLYELDVSSPATELEANPIDEIVAINREPQSPVVERHPQSPDLTPQVEAEDKKDYITAIEKEIGGSAINTPSGEDESKRK